MTTMANHFGDRIFDPDIFGELRQDDEIEGNYFLPDIQDLFKQSIPSDLDLTPFLKERPSFKQRQIIPRDLPRGRGLERYTPEQKMKLIKLLLTLMKLRGQGGNTA